MFYPEKESKKQGKGGGKGRNTFYRKTTRKFSVVVGSFGGGGSGGGITILMMSATWRPLHLWVLVSYRLVYIIDQDILQIIKHCSNSEREREYFLSERVAVASKKD